VGDLLIVKLVLDFSPVESIFSNSRKDELIVLNECCAVFQSCYFNLVSCTKTEMLSRLWRNIPLDDRHFVFAGYKVERQGVSAAASNEA
jgi:hypothetical protein